MAKEELTPKQAAFVREYLVDLNATQAAIRAGYSQKTAGQQGEALLKKLEIQQAVKEAQSVRAAKVDLQAVHVLEGLLKEARREDERSSHGARVRAWELLGKHLGMLTDTSRVEVGGDLSAYLAASLSRMNKLYAPPATEE